MKIAIQAMMNFLFMVPPWFFDNALFNGDYRVPGLKPRASVLRRPPCAMGNADLSVGERPTTCRQLLLPLAAVEWLHLDALDRPPIETARVDAVTIRMRARHVERFDATGRAEQVLRGSGVECVGRQGISAPEQSK